MREILRKLKDSPGGYSGSGSGRTVTRQPMRTGANLRPPSSNFSEKPKNFKYKDLKLLFPFVRPHWKLGLIAGLTALAGTIATILIPLAFRFLADDAVLDGNHKLLNTIVLVVMCVFTFIALADFFKQIYFCRFQQQVILDVQRSLFDRLLRLPKTFFDSNSTGYLMSRVAGDVFQLQAFFSMNLVDVFAKGLQLICAVGILLYLSWKLALLSLLVLPLFVLISRLLTKKTRRASRAAIEKAALVSRDLQERLSGAALIKAFAAEDRETQALLDSMREAVDSNQKRIRINSFFTLLSSVINACGMGCVLWYGSSLIIQQQMTVGELLAFSAYLGFLIEPAKFFANLNNALQHSFAALERVFEIMSLVAEDEHDETKVKLDKVEGGVQFDNVCFSYDGTDLALDHVSFKVEPGQVVAIVGPSGAGKSTLINHILCLYQPTSGKVSFGSMPADELNLQSLRERIGIVSQEIFLFNDSVRNNIRYGLPGAFDEEVIRASQIADAHEFICELPDGYDTIVGEKGVKLSVGQKQRLSIARAILKDPDILIFDEATSALDSVTEQTVQLMLREFCRGKTVFAIAHRLSTLALCDLVLVLDKGRVVQHGTPGELWEQEGLYRELCKTQFLQQSSGTRI